MMKMC